MKFCYSQLVTLFIACFLSTMLPTIASGSTVKIPVPAPFQPARNQEGSIQYVSVENIENTFRQFSPAIKPIHYNNKIKHFIVPEASWFLQTIDCYQRLLFDQNIRPSKEQWDCDNYSMLLTAFANIRLWQAGYFDTKLAIGWLKVDAKVSWSRIPAGLHALMFGVSANDIFIIEPQNGSYIRLSEYPNREHIKEVYLF